MKPDIKKHISHFAQGDDMLLFVAAQPTVLVYDNNIDALIPELWAQEGLAILD